MKRIHQFAAGFNPGDAISNEILAIRTILENNGFAGNIYAKNIGLHLKDSKTVKKYYKYKYSPGDLIIYHHSIHSTVSNFVLNSLAPKFMIYHNVTPHHFFESYDLKLTHYVKKGREELKNLKDKFMCYFADSKYNREELNSLDFTNVHILPIIYDFQKLQKKESVKKDGFKNIIFVGRIAPNKKQDDLIRFAKMFKDYFCDKFKIHLVGYCSKELNLYKEELDYMVKFYQLDEHVLFSDYVDDDKLQEYYQSADLFISMSEHEGFCVPLIESMFYEIPILAYQAGAVGDTLNGAGISFNQKDFLKICELVHIILKDQDFRNEIINSQNKRLKQFIDSRPESILLEEIGRLQKI
ncbi:MAG: glycosyltransferase [Leptospiraceae bacterium]|nr:glycosyltransferase [Leptospiraceae bacterium]